MNDKELADKIVALGVGWYESAYMTTEGEYCGAADDFVRDWRVAGAMLDKVHDLPEPYKWIAVMRDIRRIPLGDPLERPINEFCVEALTAVGDRQND